jgi:hypothetical protein
MPFSERIKGRIAAGGVSIGGASPRSSGVFVLKLPLSVLAQANTDFVASIPQGATLLGGTVLTNTAFTGTTCAITIGSTAGGADYVASVSVKAQAAVSLSLAAGAGIPLALNLPAPPNIFVRLAQTGATNVGAGMLHLTFAT